MKNFTKVLSNEGVCCGYPNTPSRLRSMSKIGVTRDRIKRGVAKLLEKFIKFNTYGFAIRKPLRKVYQTTGMQSIHEHHVNRGIGLRGHRIKRGVAL
ncbi:Uncharacterised protein [uncultured archaeon]|nr:Uncharacterised protein [uncultured archaeon]